MEEGCRIVGINFLFFGVFDVLILNRLLFEGFVWGVFHCVSDGL